jgi:hypothetical protein
MHATRNEQNSVKRVVIILLALAMFSSAQVRPGGKKKPAISPPLEFRGIRVGMTFEEVSKIVEETFRERLQDCSLPNVCITGFVRPEFMNGKLVLCRIKVTSAFYRPVRLALIQKYSLVRPRVSVESFTNAYGRVTYGAKNTWIVGTRSLVLEEIDTSMREDYESDPSGSVTLTDLDLYPEYYAAHKQLLPPI